MKLDNRKVRTLRKLVEFGADTEKKITDLGLEDIVRMNKETGLTFQEMELVSELKEAIREKQVISYLVLREEKDETRRGDEERGNDTNAEGNAGVYREDA